MGYILNTGEDDKKRLDILSEIYNPKSQSFIKNNVSDEIITILDIGCGQGHITKWLSKNFNKAKILGIDSSIEQISICKNNINDNKNISFMDINILDSDSVDSIKQNFSNNIDLIYARYLLLHIPFSKWDSFFNNVFNLLKPGGSLILEEPGLPAVSYPNITALSTGANLSKQYTEQLDLKLDCIEPLWNYIKTINTKFKIENVDFNQPILKSEISKSLLSKSFDQIVPALIKSNLLPENEIKQMSDDINCMVKDPNYIATAFRLIQLHLTKVI